MGSLYDLYIHYFFFFQAEDGIRDVAVTGVQTCALPILLPLDLHVLGTPPAFNLSQDQTLHLKISRIIKKSGSKMAPTYCWTFWSLGLFAKGSRRESPHKLPAKLLKSTPERLAWEKGRKVYVNRMLGPQPDGPRRVAAGAARGAQYSPDWGVVNARSGMHSGPPGGGLEGVGRGRTCPRGGARRRDRFVQGFGSSLSLAKRRDPTWKTCSAPAPRVRVRSVTRAPSIFTAPSSILRLASEVLAVRPAALRRFATRRPAPST